MFYLIFRLRICLCFQFLITRSALYFFKKLIKSNDEVTDVNHEVLHEALRDSKPLDQAQKVVQKHVITTLCERWFL